MRALFLAMKSTRCIPRIQSDRSFYCSCVMKWVHSPDLQWLRWPQLLSRAMRRLLFDDLFLKNRDKLTFHKSTASPKFHVHYVIVRAELMRSRVCSMSVPRVLHESWASSTSLCSRAKHHAWEPMKTVTRIRTTRRKWCTRSLSVVTFR